MPKYVGRLLKLQFSIRRVQLVCFDMTYIVSGIGIRCESYNNMIALLSHVWGLFAMKPTPSFFMFSRLSAERSSRALVDFILDALAIHCTDHDEFTHCCTVCPVTLQVHHSCPSEVPNIYVQ
jgi:hypothetical protein